MVNNVAPVALDDTYATDEDIVLNIAARGVLVNDTDFDPTILTAVMVTEPDNGTLVLNADGSFIYTPEADFNGTDSFAYKANDGLADSNIATVTITVTSVLDAPTVSSTNLPGPYMVGLEQEFQVTLTNPDNGDDLQMFCSLPPGRYNWLISRASSILRRQLSLTLGCLAACSRWH